MNNTLFDLPESNPGHPAKYTISLFRALVQFARGSRRLLDPFGGTGRIFLLSKWFPEMEIRAVEIEREWAKINPKTIIGSALALPFPDNYFDTICTSPTYGNRLSDFTLPYSKGGRFSYVDSIGRRLHSDNSANFLWGDKYRDFHERAWLEALRVLGIGGKFILNIKNHIKDGKEQLVTEWHIETLRRLGFEEQETIRAYVPSIRFGKNYDKRIEYESVIKFVLKRKYEVRPCP